jgi:hypothetical protein
MFNDLLMLRYRIYIIEEVKIKVAETFYLFKLFAGIYIWENREAVIEFMDNLIPALKLVIYS